MQLRAMMARDITIGNINEYGFFDKLKETVNMDIAKAYFEEKEGQAIKSFRIKQRVDTTLRQFILSGGSAFE